MVISLTYKTLQSNKTTHLNDLLHIQRNWNTRSSDTVTLQRPSVCSSLKLMHRSFTHHAPVLWSSLPKQHRIPTPHHLSINQTGSTLALSSSQFHTKLKTFLFNRSLQTLQTLVWMHYPQWCEVSRHVLVLRRSRNPLYSWSWSQKLRSWSSPSSSSSFHLISFHFICLQHTKKLRNW